MEQDLLLVLVVVLLLLLALLLLLKLAPLRHLRESVSVQSTPNTQNPCNKHT